MLRALFWITVGFIGGVLLDEWLNMQQREGREAVGTPPSPAVFPYPPAIDPAPAGNGKSGQKAVATAAPQPAVKEDLTQIKGIGPTFAKRLVAGGITTLRQLAAADPDTLREITNVREWQRPSAEEWIAEAQTLI